MKACVLLQLAGVRFESHCRISNPGSRYETRITQVLGNRLFEQSLEYPLNGKSLMLFGQGMFAGKVI